MAGATKLFFASSENSTRELTYLFDFVWPTAAALWNLQWQAKGFRTQVPSVTEDELNARFVSGSGIRGVNFARLEAAGWGDVQQWFARLLLSETCALFEGWIKSVLDELVLPSSYQRTGKQALDKKLQFPSKYDNAGNATGGAWFGIESLRPTGGIKCHHKLFRSSSEERK
jgi:hypothetical protein